jgi:hypothetical protein
MCASCSLSGVCNDIHYNVMDIDCSAPVPNMLSLAIGISRLPKTDQAGSDCRERAHTGGHQFRHTTSSFGGAEASPLSLWSLVLKTHNPARSLRHRCLASHGHT